MLLTRCLGQICWTSALSPAKYKRTFSYWNGVVTSMEVHFTNCATFVLTADVLAATITVLTNGKYTATSWHLYLYTVALLIFAGLVNSFQFSLNAYSKLTNAMTAVIVATTIFQAIALLVRAHPKQTAHQVFVEVVNETGWSSLGVVFLMGLLPGSSSVAGFDFASHMTEEVPNPARNIPIVMISVAFFGGLAGVFMVVVLMFCTVQPANLLTPIGGFALAQLSVDAYRSEALTGTTMVLYTIIFTIGSMSLFTATSRVVWSFSQHKGYAFSTKLGLVNQKTQIPVNAVVATTIVGIVVCALELGPATAMSALFSSIFLSTWAAYGMPIWLLIFRGRKILPANRSLNLGRFGLVINILAVSWQFILMIFLSFPQYLPVTVSNMNYAAPVFVACIILFGLNWFLYSRKRYLQPVQLHVRTGYSEESGQKLA